jgi:hypothetical protein
MGTPSRRSRLIGTALVSACALFLLLTYLTPGVPSQTGCQFEEPTPTPPPGCEFNTCDSGSHWDEGQCCCAGNISGSCDLTPVLIDVDGDGYHLTDARGGVPFDLDRDGVRESLSWTAAGSDDAWLVLDRNGNGVVDDGSEMFGNFTEQPTPPPGASKNGFLALAEFDKPGSGGNGDGVIDGRDAVFAFLRLWADANHDGVSGPGETRLVSELGLSSVGLDYKESRRVDRHGNRFRYRAKVADVRGAQTGRWACDVLLVNAPR